MFRGWRLGGITQTGGKRSAKNGRKQPLNTANRWQSTSPTQSPFFPLKHPLSPSQSPLSPPKTLTKPPFPSQAPFTPHLVYRHRRTVEHVLNVTRAQHAGTGEGEVLPGHSERGLRAFAEGWGRPEGGGAGAFWEGERVPEFVGAGKQDGLP